MNKFLNYLLETQCLDQNLVNFLNSTGYDSIASFSEVNKSAEFGHFKFKTKQQNLLIRVTTIFNIFRIVFFRDFVCQIARRPLPPPTSQT